MRDWLGGPTCCQGDSPLSDLKLSERPPITGPVCSAWPMLVARPLCFSRTSAVMLSHSGDIAEQRCPCIYALERFASAYGARLFSCLISFLRLKQLDQKGSIVFFLVPLFPSCLLEENGMFTCFSLTFLLEGNCVRATC